MLKKINLKFYYKNIYNRIRRVKILISQREIGNLEEGKRDPRKKWYKTVLQSKIKFSTQLKFCDGIYSSLYLQVSSFDSQILLTLNPRKNIFCRFLYIRELLKME